MADYKIGTITHYYDQMGVAIVELTAPLHIGERIRISGQTDFTQLVESLQSGHEEVPVAEAGETIGLKVRQPVTPGDEVVKLVTQ